MYRIVCVKVVETLCHIQQLMEVTLQIEWISRGKTNQADPVHARMFLDVLRKGSVGHPL